MTVKITLGSFKKIYDEIVHNFYTIIFCFRVSSMIFVHNLTPAFITDFPSLRVGVPTTTGSLSRRPRAG